MTSAYGNLVNAQFKQGMSRCALGRKSTAARRQVNESRVCERGYIQFHRMRSGVRDGQKGSRSPRFESAHETAHETLIIIDF